MKQWRAQQQHPPRFRERTCERRPLGTRTNRTLRNAAWSKMQDIIDAYPSATVLTQTEPYSALAKGNDEIRAIIAFDFRRRTAFIKFVAPMPIRQNRCLKVNLYS